jgi:predicted AAA+ superfamily ATPase
MDTKEIKRNLAGQLQSLSSLKKIMVILGPRQVGKTTLLHQLTADQPDVLSFDCDNMDDRLALENRTKTELAALMGRASTIIIDEAQRVRNIGMTLKMLGDLHLDAQIYVTGSSSLQLADDINEPATGRLLEFNLYPFSLSELAAHTSEREEKRLLEFRMIYGTYPEIVNHSEHARMLLQNIVNSYLYKDLLEYKGIKKPDVLRKLVTALALQIGNEVSYNELANLLGVDKETVENYIDLLEKCFVVFRMDSFSRNARNEIKKGKKIYFFDTGVRNAIINNFSPLEMRNDVGALWENLMMVERRKRHAYSGKFVKQYFWRKIKQQEIDLIEECDGQISAFEYKWKAGKVARLPLPFSEAYPDATFQTITPDNYQEFV